MRPATPDAEADSPARPSTGFLALVVGVLAFALYVSTMAPGLLWGDDAELQRLAILGHAAGGARNYVLWTGLAHPFTLLPFGDPAWRVTLACAVFAAVAVGAMVFVLRETGCPRWIAVAGAVALAVSHSFWLHAVRTEVYSLLAMTLAVATALLVAAHRRGDDRALLVPGLAIAVVAAFAHPLALTFVPGFAVLVLGTRAPRDRLAIPVLAVTGLILAAYVFQRSTSLTGTGFSASEFVAGLRSVTPRRFALWAGFLGYQFLALLPLALTGLVATWRKDPVLGLFSVLAYVGSISFGFAFPVADYYVFYIPSYLLVVFWIAQGARALWERMGRPRAFGPALLALALLPIPVYATVPGILERAGTSPVPVRTIPYRDNLRFFLDPPLNGDQGARRFGEEVFAALPESAAVLADWTPFQVFRYLQEVEGRRRDVVLEEIMVPGGQARWVRVQNSRRRPVFLADDNAYYDLEEIGREFAVEPAGHLFRLVPRPEAPR